MALSDCLAWLSVYVCACVCMKWHKVCGTECLGGPPLCRGRGWSKAKVILAGFTEGAAAHLHFPLILGHGAGGNNGFDCLPFFFLSLSAV